MKHANYSKRLTYLLRVISIINNILRINKPVLRRLNLVLIKLPRRQIMNLTNIQISIILERNLRIRLEMTIVMTKTTGLNKSLRINIITNRNLLTRLNRNQILTILINNRTTRVLQTNNTAKIKKENMSTFQEVRPISRLNRANLILNLKTSNRSNNTVAIELRTIKVSLRILGQDRRRTSTFNLILIKIRAQLTRPTPSKRRNLTINSLNPRNVPILNNKVEVSRPRKFNLIRRLRNLLMSTTLLNNKLRILAINKSRRKALINMTRPTTSKYNILRRVTIPVLRR